MHAPYSLKNNYVSKQRTENNINLKNNCAFDANDPSMKETTTVSKILAAKLVTSHILYICDRFSILNTGTKSKFAHITPNNNKNTPL